METNITDLLRLTKKNFTFAIGVFILVNILSILFTFYAVPDRYSSEATLAPVYGGKEIKSSSSLSALASLGGINLQANSGGIPRHLMAIEYIRSKKLFNKIADQDFLENLHNLDYFDPHSGISYFKGKRNKSYKFEDSHLAFLKSLEIRTNRESGIIKISITHFSPKTAQQWLTKIISLTNYDLKNDHIRESDQKISFLQSTISKEDDLEIRKAMIQLLKDELAEYLLINHSEQYALKILDPPSLPTKKSYPSRINLLVMGLLIALFFSFLSIFLIEKKKNFPN